MQRHHPSPPSPSPSSSCFYMARSAKPSTSPNSHGDLSSPTAPSLRRRRTRTIKAALEQSRRTRRAKRLRRFFGRLRTPSLPHTSPYRPTWSLPLRSESMIKARKWLPADIFLSVFSDTRLEVLAQHSYIFTSGYESFESALRALSITDRRRRSTTASLSCCIALRFCSRRVAPLVCLWPIDSPS